MLCFSCGNTESIENDITISKDVAVEFNIKNPSSPVTAISGQWSDGTTAAVEYTWNIQPAERDLSGVSGGAGKITGTTTDMQYHLVGANDWYTCSDGSTTVPAGEYEVMYSGEAQGDPNYRTDESAVQVTVTAASTGTITIIVPSQPEDNKPANGNPTTGAAPSSLGYVIAGTAVVGALYIAAKKLTQKEEK